MIISCVLRQSLAFGPEHVEWLGRQAALHYPDARFVPYSDVPLKVPHERLKESLPTWWSKMEALRALKDDTVLMLDLDTVLIKRIELPVPSEGNAIMQTAPRDINKVWGGLQFSSRTFRELVTSHFFQDPQGRIAECGGDDQKYYRLHWLPRIAVLNVERPDAVVSYKMHVMQQGIQPENAFVMFHGMPRPWQVEHEWCPPLFPLSE